MAKTAELARTFPVSPPFRAEIGLPTTSLLQPGEPRQSESPQVLIPTPEQFAAVADTFGEAGKPTDQEAWSSVLRFFDLAAKPLSLHPAREHILQAMNCLAWARAMCTETWVREPTTYPVEVQLRAFTLHRDTIATFGQVAKAADNHGTRQETINVLTMLSLLNLPAQHRAMAAYEIGDHETGRSLWSIARVISQDPMSPNGKDTYSSFWDYCQRSAPSINRLFEIAISQN